LGPEECKLAEEAVRLGQWQRAKRDPELEAIGPAPKLQPLRKLLAKPDSAERGAREKGVLKSIVAGGQWPQARPRDAGLAADPYCKLCGCYGTVQHRRKREAHQLFRDEHGDPGLLGLRHECPEWLVWRRGIVPDLGILWSTPLQELSIVWTIPARGGALEGVGYGDGSGILRKFGDAYHRCGWGLAVVDAAGCCVGRCHGPLPGPVQGVPEADHFALLIYVLHAGIEALHFKSDCAILVDGYAKGHAARVDGWNPMCAIWRRIWDRLDVLGLALTVTKAKAHLKQADATKGKISARDHDGNGMAGTEAKLEARGHPRCEPLLHVQAVLTSLASRAARFLRSVTARLGAGEAPRDSESVESARADQVLFRWQPAVTNHARGAANVVSIENGKLRCLYCQQVAGSWKGLAHLGRAHHGTGAGHRLLTLGKHAFCNRCGKFSASRTGGLRSACRVPTGGILAYGKRLLEGRDPYTGKCTGQPTRAAALAGIGAPDRAPMVTHERLPAVDLQAVTREALAMAAALNVPPPKVLEEPAG